MKNPTGQKRNNVFWVGLILFLINIFFWTLTIFRTLYPQNNGNNLFIILGFLITPISLTLWCFGQLFATAIKESKNKVNIKNFYQRNERHEFTKTKDANKETIDNNNPTIKLCEHLKQIGLDASIISMDYRPIGTFGSNMIIGVVKIAGCNIDSIVLELKPKNVMFDLFKQGSIRGLPDFKAQNCYRCHYVIRSKMYPLISNINADSEFFEKSTSSKQNIDVKWDGEELAGILNNDVKLHVLCQANLMDLKNKGLNELPILEIKSFINSQFISIRQKQFCDSPTDIFPTLETFKVYNRIAYHTRKLAIPVEGLCEHLKQIGLDATIQFTGAVHENHSPSTMIIGSVRIANRNINLIELEWQRVEVDGEYSSYCYDIYRCNYVVETKIKSDHIGYLRAQGKPVRKLFGFGQVVDFKWEGEALAEILNHDNEIKKCLVFSEITFNIIPYGQFTKIIREWKNEVKFPWFAYPNIATFEIYDRMAGHIKSIVAYLKDG